MIPVLIVTVFQGTLWAACAILFLTTVDDYYLLPDDDYRRVIPSLLCFVCLDACPILPVPGLNPQRC